jgi:hypothetical protein
VAARNVFAGIAYIGQVRGCTLKRGSFEHNYEISDIRVTTSLIYSAWSIALPCRRLSMMYAKGIFASPTFPHYEVPKIISSACVTEFSFLQHKLYDLLRTFFPV